MLTRRGLLRTLGLIGNGAAALPATGCTAGTAATGVVVVAADVARAEPDPAAGIAAAAALQAFTLELFKRLEAPGQNAVCSPYSVAVALAMTRNGAAGTSAEEMDEVLHLAPVDALDAGYNALTQAIESRAGEQARADGTTATVSLDVANSLWGQRDVTWQPAFLDGLARSFGAGMHPVDYAADTEGARSDINDWVSDQTHEKIPELIAEGVLDADTRLVLVNAIYLKAPWESPFEKSGTTTEPFYRWDGTTVDVEMMSQVLDAEFASGQVWRAVRLRYAGGALAMAIVVLQLDAVDIDPAKVTLGGLLGEGGLETVLGSFEPASVVLGLPRWNVRTQVGLKDALTTLGMPTAFDATAADFSGMTTDEQLYVSAVVHGAVVAVDEEGTEAAAATAVVMRRTSAPAQQVEFTVNGTFYFVIHDVETGAPLFIGKVDDPTAPA